MYMNNESAVCVQMQLQCAASKRAVSVARVVGGSSELEFVTEFLSVAQHFRVLGVEVERVGDETDGRVQLAALVGFPAETHRCKYMTW